VHYGTFRYDLSDFVDKVHAMLHDYNLNPKKLELMANNSANTAVEVFNFLAQLDSLMYAVLQVRVCLCITLLLKLQLAGAVTLTFSHTQ
jgi:hypothetical protein